jgi:glycogen debranching enzyme
LQATERDDYRDAEPGKIMHELRLGELATLKLVPHTPYYGSADATPLYLITLHTAWCCTGDRDLLKRHLPTAERCLDWIDKYGDRDGDGFQEYATRSSAGLENQSWKDSGDALVYPDGALVKGPKALCELQGYVYDAWLRMAEIYDALNDSARATALRAKAAVLFVRFNEAFWDEETGFYAFALDGEKKKVLSVASNPGHCLWSGIVPPERAGRVVARLMQPDMWSGWGIRTLSSNHASYNPYSYQNGSVWPHDNGLIAQGFKRYGYAAEAGRVAQDVCQAGSFFMLNQLPELYAGLHRDAANFPVQYLGANVPQAWAAGSVFSMVQAMLGFQPDAPHGMLYVDPALPPWLGDLTVRDLRIGEQVFDIRFWRSDEETRFDVVKGDPTCIACREVAVWSDLLKRSVRETAA